MAALRDGFTSLVRHRVESSEAQLADWMVVAMGSGIGECRTFVARLQQDRDVVLAGQSLPWS